MIKELSREERRKRRHLRIRRKIRGTPERPRLCIKKSLRHIYAQVVDDVSNPNGSVSLLIATTNTKEFKSSGRKHFCNMEYARLLGHKVGELLKQKGITQVVFDRSGYPYHGIVKAFADAVREKGINF